jgi:hypothetical protein
MSYTRRGNEHKNDSKRMSQLRERAMNDPLVHAQLVEMMEEDPEVLKYFTKHVEKKYGSQWDKLQPDEKTLIIKQEMTKNRIPRKGGKKTKKRKATARRRANTRKNRKTNRTSKNRH